MSGGLYVVLISLRRPTEVRMAGGRSGLLPSGWYVYTGSARPGLDARVARHLEQQKRVRWHIDQLTTDPAARTLGAVVVADPPEPVVPAGSMGPERLTECGLNRIVGSIVGRDCPVRSFGATDCRSACPAHLWRSPTRLTLKALAAELRSAGVPGPRVVHPGRRGDRPVVTRFGGPASSGPR